jgi:hypothetical protein
MIPVLHAATNSVGNALDRSICAIRYATVEGAIRWRMEQAEVTPRASPRVRCAA